MKKYKVKVNGQVYEVELEAIEEVSGSIEAKPANAPAAPVSEGANNILSPIGGKVLDVKVKVGDMINKGDTVCIIEAMKLENEVKSAYTGKVVEVRATKGAMVANKDVLVVLG